MSSKIEQISSRVPPTAPKATLGSWTWWILSKIPWYFYLIAIVAVWFKFGQGKEKKVARR